MKFLLQTLSHIGPDPVTAHALLSAANAQAHICGEPGYTAEGMAALLTEAESNGMVERYGAGWQIVQVAAVKRAMQTSLF